ncbi:hypothetical protein [Geminisphaera colitermitum]|uniref:hypothetical protein n=1 Tax=Geminisphaera colitermitum TaxID=1148786 RepID=UPI000158C70D|nr:hypothetical protein [Geminisphaera colitermitum]
MSGESNTHPIREITTHRVNPANDKIRIIVNDAPGAGGANHRYELTGFDTANNPSKSDPQGYTASFSRQVILFQNGPIPEAGVNGVTQEVLLAIVQDRLEAFQKGPFATEENQRALDAVKEAQHWLQFRTLKRMARGVEGTHIK